MPDCRIWSRANPGKPLVPEIYYGISDQELLEIDLEWTLYKNREALIHGAPEHHDWRWSEKGDSIDPHIFVGLKYNREAQGLMMVSMNPTASRRPEAADEKVLYIEYLETAPWNQSLYAGSAGTRFLGVGGCLISVAIRMSHIQGYNGRVGLHSLPLAKGFYVSQGFENFGVDPLEQLDYFELR